MPKYTLVKLSKMTPLHVGSGKENYDFAAADLSSDTLSSALAAIKARKGECEDLQRFLDSFTLSSAFPYVGEYYYLPRPKGRVNIEILDGDEYVAKKKLKKIKFIELGLWQELIAGKTLKVKKEQLRGVFLLPTLKTTSNGEDSVFIEPYKKSVSQRVAVPRDEGKDAEPFFFEWTYFKEGSGLYCLLDAPDDIKTEVIELFRELGIEGIGTDKSVGGGKFEIEAESKTFPEVEDSDCRMLLSTYIPNKEEIDGLNLQDSCYELILRGGYISGSDRSDFLHLRKKSVYMFNTASVFKTVNSLEGKIVDLRPKWENMHPVYRSGKALSIGIKQAK